MALHHRQPEILSSACHAPTYLELLVVFDICSIGNIFSLCFQNIFCFYFPERRRLLNIPHTATIILC
jgi:hypothetical protein